MKIVNAVLTWGKGRKMFSAAANSCPLQWDFSQYFCPVPFLGWIGWSDSAPTHTWDAHSC